VGCKNSHFGRFSLNLAKFIHPSVARRSTCYDVVRKALLALCFLLISRASIAQELDAQVELNISALPEEQRMVWENFKMDVEAYLNSHRWTTNFSGERIRSTFQFNVVGANGDDYNVQLFVTSSRPLYENSELTTMARFFDEKLEFSYVRGQELSHGMNFRPLESVLDFYAYIIIGLDYDSYKRQEGTQYFQQAHQMAVIGSAAQGRGWEKNFSSTGQYSRLAYIEDILNANNRVYRDLMWMYNYTVLDLATTKPDEARANLATVIDSMVVMKRSNSFFSRSPFIRTFFEAKYPELTDLARFFPDNINAYFQKLIYLDPLHQNYYEEAKRRVIQGIRE
jgi:hypothetical protein